ncbi:tryptophan 7-halogenase [Shewanella sp. Scap07]|uniref:tryptophan halogenase family protein n=1 Tax=Shewanella sp. Scap07 TaxID=2589987 RepID=UPI0015B976AB|nr:tryptophan halogenase family protein [Shewanella sp. Scap07]QLE84662.1 tryptophan 7-halogenase [Shewanella sp. Scap07]
MESSANEVNSIVIVGGGTSGWMTAAALSQHFKDKPVSITLVESSQIGTIGVGEATIPTLRRFYAKLGLTDTDVLKATNATCKLGIEFKDWSTLGDSFIHPFGIFGQGTKETDFHHYWLRAMQAGHTTAFSEYSLGVQLARSNKFTYPSTKPESQLEVYDWALHFDASLFAELMKQVALQANVMVIDDKIEQVNTDNHNGHISSLQLASGGQVKGDLFIDCSGFRSMLLQQTLNTGYCDWSEWLLCDKAVAVQTKASDDPIARTLSHAQKAGWIWKIPLQHRTGNGHVYSSQFMSEEQAEQCLLQQLDGPVLHEPRHFSFTPGRAQKAWNKNCIAVGLSSGFLEPLESTSIALVETAIEKICLSFPANQYTNRTVDKFNDVTAAEYERVRDFIILHYKATQRNDSPMWRYCQQMDIPQSLADKLAAYQKDGTMLAYPWEIFGKDSWLAIYHGFGLIPEQYATKADNMEQAYLLKHMHYMKSRVAQSVNSAPTHKQFLYETCGFEAGK